MAKMATRNCILLFSCIMLIGVHHSQQTTTAAPNTTEPESTTVSGSTSTASTTTDSSTASSTLSDPVTTKVPVVKCYNGTCLGNASDENDFSCINVTIEGRCELAAGESCFQTVFKNSSTIHYEVGCKKDCEYLHEEGEGTGTISTTRCCDAASCNGKLINDPGSENSAASVTSSMFAIVCIAVLIV